MQEKPVAPSLLPFLCAALLCACGEPPVDPAIALAVQTENRTEQAAKKLNAAEAKQNAEAKAATDAEKAALDAALTAAAHVPDPLPADLETACDGFVASYDAFMQSGPEKDALQWWDGRRRKIGEHRSKCVSRGSIAVAACGSVALAKPLPALAKYPRDDAAQMVLLRCDDQFGKT